MAVKVLPLLLDNDATRPTCEATMLLRDTVEKAVVVRASDPRDRAAVSADLRMCMVALSTTVGYKVRKKEEEGGRPTTHLRVFDNSSSATVLAQSSLSHAPF